MSLESLGGLDLKRMFIAATNVLEEHKGEVDALNVFPVPDGDTGTNMSLTMQSAAREIQKANSATVHDIAQAVALGSLMGARGNSGVILSQLFRGMARSMERKKSLTPAELAWALQEGVNTAYKAVMKPVEGTILTVSREAARAAVNAARAGADAAEVMEAALYQGEQTLAQTPNMLPVLKKAGVVDAGGKGLVYILAGMVEAIRGRVTAEHRPETPRAVEFAITEEMGDIRFPYDTMFMIRGNGLSVSDIQRALTPFGDCLLVVGDDRLVKIHIHTDNPGPVLDYCVRLGELTQFEILNMREQHDELKRAAGPEPAGIEEEQEEEPGRAVGVVSVAIGEGIINIMNSLGADEIITGGQTMNPSTEDILNAVNRVKSESVIVLPNNSNVILAAEQARPLAKKDVRVVPTKSIPQGIAALLAWQPGADLETNAAAMAQAVVGVQTGEITYAVRDSSFEDHEIKEGDILGLWNGKIALIGRDAEDVLKDLVARMAGDDSEIITIFYGEGIPAERAEALREELSAAYPGHEVEVHHGGQPLYYYIFSVE